MTVRDLDRLVSKTEMSPVSKSSLRWVRRALVSGRCGDPKIGTAGWSVAIDTMDGQSVRMRFSFKRNADD